MAKDNWRQTDDMDAYADGWRAAGDGPSPQMLVRYGMARSAAASAATLSATDKNGNVTMSNGNLTATSSFAGDVCGRGTTATTAIGAGVKRIWRVTVTIQQVGGVAAGVCNASQTFGDGVWLGSTANSCGWARDGKVYINGGQVASFASFTQGDNLYLACDGGNKLYGAVNAAPDVLTGGADISALGTVYPGYNLGGFAQAGDRVTALFSDPLGIVNPAGYSVFP